MLCRYWLQLLLADDPVIYNAMNQQQLYHMYCLSLNIAHRQLHMCYCSPCQGAVQVVVQPALHGDYIVVSPTHALT